MLWSVTATLMLTVVFSEGKTIRCKCWDGYKPQIDKDGPHCFGVKLTHIMPCNLPQPPRCVCTGSVNNILKDSTGTWCTTYQRGHELRRWPCENTDQWDAFFRKHPNYN